MNVKGFQLFQQTPRLDVAGVAEDDHVEKVLADASHHPGKGRPQKFRDGARPRFVQFILKQEKCLHIEKKKMYLSDPFTFSISLIQFTAESLTSIPY